MVFDKNYQAMTELSLFRKALTNAVKDCIIIRKMAVLGRKAANLRTGGSFPAIAAAGQDHGYFLPCPSGGEIQRENEGVSNEKRHGSHGECSVAELRMRTQNQLQRQAARTLCVSKL